MSLNWAQLGPRQPLQAGWRTVAGYADWLAPFGRCVRRRLAGVRYLRRCGRPQRAPTAGRVSVRQELFGLCPRSDERAWPEVRRALASRVEPTEYTEHVLPCA